MVRGVRKNIGVSGSTTTTTTTTRTIRFHIFRLRIVFFVHGFSTVFVCVRLCVNEWGKNSCFSHTPRYVGGAAGKRQYSRTFSLSSLAQTQKKGNMDICEHVLRTWPWASAVRFLSLRLVLRIQRNHYQFSVRLTYTFAHAMLRSRNSMADNDDGVIRVNTFVALTQCFLFIFTLVRAICTMLLQ